MVNESAHLGVLAFGVFAHHHHVDLAGLSQRRNDAGIEHRRANIGELIEAAADGQQQPVERDVVGDFGIANRAQQDRVQRPQQVQGVGWHHAAVAEIIFGAPFEVLEIEGNVEPGANGLQHAERRGHHFLAHAVARNDRDGESFHARLHRSGIGFPPASLLRCAASRKANISRVSSLATGGRLVWKNWTISRTSGP